MQGRNVSLDYLKGWGIIAVVFCHHWRGLNGSGLLAGVPPDWYHVISTWPTLLSMPAFFFASGLLYGRSMERRHGALEFAGKFDGIFYPYVLWTLIIGVVEVLTSGMRNGQSSLASVLTSLWIPTGIFWFLSALLLAFAITELCIKLIGIRRTRWGLLPLSLLLLLTWRDTRLPLAIAELQLSLVYFAVGIWLAPRIDLKQRPSWLRFIACLAMLAALLYGVGFVMGVHTASAQSVTPNATGLALVVLALMWAACISLPAQGLSALQILGERSMDIYLLHLLLLGGGRILLHKGLGIDNAVVIASVCLPLALGGSLLGAEALRRTGLGFLFSPPPALSMRRWLNAKRS